MRHSRQRQLRPIGMIRSDLKLRRDAPMQGFEGAPDAWLELNRSVRAAVEGLSVGDEIIVLTWFHRADRRLLAVHPRSDPTLPVTGVFATRSPDRPNPVGLHRVTIRAIEPHRLKIGPIEALDGTPVVDIKPVLGDVHDG
jgi:tRNA-Thr(GGU) m(6)t(6)A37 methyltransferase TsaA